MVVLFGLWGLALVLLWPWFHVEPLSGWSLSIFLLIGGAVMVVMDRIGPVPPMPGRTSEEHAADAFFAGRSVRSDDHRFLPGDAIDDGNKREHD